MLTRRITRPHIMGYWAIQITPQQEMIKFGADGDTKYPHKTARQAITACRNLKESDPDCRYYILRVFDNGQMKTFDYE